MLVLVKPSTRGQQTNFLRDLYAELHARGRSHSEIIAMSCSKALIAFFGSNRAVDNVFGPGALQSVKQDRGRFAHWRKIWSRVIDAQKALQPMRIAMLEGITNTIETCKQVGLTDAEIKDKVSESLVARDRTKSA